jgi:hypothetical protein
VWKGLWKDLLQHPLPGAVALSSLGFTVAEVLPLVLDHGRGEAGQTRAWSIPCVACCSTSKTRPWAVSSRVASSLALCDTSMHVNARLFNRGDNSLFYVFSFIWHVPALYQKFASILLWEAYSPVHASKAATPLAVAKILLQGCLDPIT